MALIYQEKSFKNMVLKHEVFQTLFLKLLRNTKIKKNEVFSRIYCKTLNLS